MILAGLLISQNYAQKQENWPTYTLSNIVIGVYSSIKKKNLQAVAAERSDT